MRLFLISYIFFINSVLAFTDDIGFYQQINKSLEIKIFKKELKQITNKLRLEVEELEDLDTLVLIHADLPTSQQVKLNKAFVSLHDNYSKLIREVNHSNAKGDILVKRIENTLKYLSKFKKELLLIQGEKQTIQQSEEIIKNIEDISTNIDKAIKWSLSPKQEDQETLGTIHIPKGSFLRPISLIENKDNNEWYTEVKLVDASNNDLVGKTFKVSSKWYNVAAMETIDQEVTLQEVINQGETNEKKKEYKVGKGKSFVIVNDPGGWFYEVQIVAGEKNNINVVDVNGNIQKKGSRKTYRISKTIYNQSVIKQTVEDITKDFKKVKKYFQEKKTICNSLEIGKVEKRSKNEIIGCKILNNKSTFKNKDFKDLKYCLADIKKRIRDNSLIGVKEVPICEKFWTNKNKKRLEVQNEEIKTYKIKYSRLNLQYQKLMPRGKTKRGPKATSLFKKMNDTKWVIHLANKRIKKIKQGITNSCSGLNRTKTFNFIKNKLNFYEQEFLAKTLTAEGEAGILALKKNGNQEPDYHEMHAIMKVLENRKNYVLRKSPEKRISLLDIAIQPSQFSMYNRSDPGWERAILSKKSNRKNEENAIKAFMTYPDAKFENAKKVYHYVAKYVYKKSSPKDWWHEKSKVVELKINNNKVNGNSYTRHYFYKSIPWSYRTLNMRGQKW